MATATASLMTTDELLALPNDGMERWLIEGQLRERPMTRRHRWHAAAEAQITFLLKRWLVQQPKPRGKVYSGEAGCRLRRDPDTTVGIDVVYVSHEVAAQDSDDTTLIDGVPTLVVEILSPSDTKEDIDEKIDEYLKAGVPLVWIVDTHFKTMTVFQPNAPPELLNVSQEISAEPHLPGLRLSVAELFES